MSLALWIKGLIIGFSIAAPVGPIGVLCIRRTLAAGRWAGLLTGLGAATADAVYGAVAAGGVTGAAAVFSMLESPLRLGGGLFLILLGIRTFLAQPKAGAGEADRVGLVSCFVSTFFLTLTNPATIISFGAVFAVLGLSGDGPSWSSAGLLTAGVFSGSALWWLLLSGGIGLIGRRIDHRGMVWINRLSGAVLMAFGAGAGLA
ncbi:MAG: LysE family transporter [Pseudomonadota bacterium]